MIRSSFRIRAALTLFILAALIGVYSIKKSHGTGNAGVTSASSGGRGPQDSQHVLDVYSLAASSDIKILNPQLNSLSRASKLEGDLSIARVDDTQRLVIFRGAVDASPFESRYLWTEPADGTAATLTTLAGYHENTENEIAFLLMMGRLPTALKSGSSIDVINEKRWTSRIEIHDRIVQKAVLSLQEKDGDLQTFLPESSVNLQLASQENRVQSWTGATETKGHIKAFGSDAESRRRFDVQWRQQKDLSDAELAQYLEKEPEPQRQSMADYDKEQVKKARPLNEIWPAIQALAKKPKPDKVDRAYFDQKAELSYQLRDSLKRFPGQLHDLKNRMESLDPIGLELAIALSAIHNSDHPGATAALTELLDSKRDDSRWVDRVAPILGFRDDADDGAEIALRQVIDGQPHTEASHTATLSLGNLASRLSDVLRQRSIIQDLTDKLRQESNAFEQEVLILALGNTDQASVIPLIESYVQSPEETVRNSAKTALKNLRKGT